VATAAHNYPISLDRGLLDGLSHDAAEVALRRILCSVKFEIQRDACAVRLLGPEMSYHLVDPHLAAGLRRIRRDLVPSDVLAYKSSHGRFDLYFEDSWTSFFMALRHERQPEPTELVLIHLDDHTDMMATLLCQAGADLLDPTTGERFDPRLSRHWEAAIYSGAVNIGNYITPWYYSGTRVHVRHLNNASEEAGGCFISQDLWRYDLIPGKHFAALRKQSKADGSCGTYVVGTDPHEILANVPNAWTIVHVDLDYFINDFNGASPGQDYVPQAALAERALGKLDRFFDAMRSVGACIDRWLIATSPGFCSAYHWNWLLAEIDRRIEKLQDDA
jgi:hypothetical protein